MLEAIIGLAILLLIYKAVMFWMRAELNSLKDHNRKLSRSFEEDDSDE